jgi:hypothetical protein
MLLERETSCSRQSVSLGLYFRWNVSLWPGLHFWGEGGCRCEKSRNENYILLQKFIYQLFMFVNIFIFIANFYILSCHFLYYFCNGFAYFSACNLLYINEVAHKPQDLRLVANCKFVWNKNPSLATILNSRYRWSEWTKTVRIVLYAPRLQ